MRHSHAAEPATAKGTDGLKILMTTSFRLLGESDGTAMHTIKLVRALRKRGVDVVLAHLQARPPWGRPSRRDVEGTPLVVLPPVFWMSGLRRLARTFQFDIVHGQVYGATWAAPICRAFGWPLVYEMHSVLGDELLLDEIRRGPKRYIEFRLNSVLDNHAAEYAREIIVLSRSLKSVLVGEKGIEASKVNVIYPGVDLGEFAGDSVADIDGVEDDHKVIMFVGNIAWPNQGVPLLIDALARVFSSVSEARCVLVGGPADVGERYRRSLGADGDRLLVLADRSPDEIVPLVRRADVLVHPRLACRENFQVQSKIGVYLASGRPIVATDFADYQTILGDTGAALLTAARADELAAAIVRVLQSPELAAPRAAAARRVAARFFDMDRNVDRYLEIYRRALASRASIAA